MQIFDPAIHGSIEGPSKTLSMPIVFFDDFTDGGGFTANNPAIASSQGKFSELPNMGEWLVTVVDGATDSGEVITSTDAALGGWVTITTNDANNDSVEMQLNGEAFKMQAGKTVVFETRLKGTDVSEFDWFVGLAATDTTVMTAVTDRIGFECPDSTGDIDGVTEKDGTETSTDTASDLADDTMVVLRFEVDGLTSVKFFVDGEIAATHTTNLPDDQPLTPTVCIRNDGAAANTMYVDYIYCAQER